MTFNPPIERPKSDARTTEAIFAFGPQPGDYALRDAPEGRVTFDECFGRVDPDYHGEFGSEIEATALSQLGNVYEFWFKLFRSKADNRAMSPVARAIEKLFGSRLRYAADYLNETEIALSSRWLAREYWLEQLHLLVTDARRLAQRLGAVRLSLLRRLVNPTAETGSSAALAKRLNPLGAPPQIA